MKAIRVMLLVALVWLTLPVPVSAFYNPSTGRWLSRDPIGDRPKQTYSKRWIIEQANLYHFVFNNGINLRDFLGLAVNNWDIVTFPTSKLNCPSKCGPDYTAAINAEIATFRTFLDGFPNEEIDSWVDLYNTIIWFGLVARTLNYDAQAKAAVPGAPLSGCPTAKCYGTITLCGKCVTSDVPGNIMFGFLREALISDLLASFGVIIIEMLDGDGEFFEQDLNVFPLGNELHRSGSDDICTVIGKLPQHARSKCEPCSETGSFSQPFPFRKYPPPSTLDP